MTPFERRGARQRRCALAGLIGGAVVGGTLLIAAPRTPAQDTPMPAETAEVEAPASVPQTPGVRLAAPIPIPPVSERYPAAPTATRWAFPRVWSPFRHREEVNQVHEALPPSAEEVARAQAGQVSLVEAAAIKIRADEAGAPARRAAIRYLASVRCHYFPEAEAALIAALRADRNESVRIEAAQALATGCCCTSKTMEALLLAASGSERDGNPGEVSERVRAVANIALQHFAARGFTVPHPETLPPSTQKALSKGLQLISSEGPREAPKLLPMPLRTAEVKAGEGVASTCSCTSKSSLLFAPAALDVARSDNHGVLYLPPPTPPPPGPTANTPQILQATFTEHRDRPESADRLKPAARTESHTATNVTDADLRFAETAGVIPPPGSGPSAAPSTVAPRSACDASRTAVEPIPAIRLAPIGVLPPQLPH